MVRYTRTMRAFSSLVCSAALAAVLLVGCGRSTSSDADVLPPKQAAQVLIDRNWIDIWPTAPDERLHVYRFTPAMGGGVYQDRTVFKGQFELFVFKTDGRRLLFGMPETREQVKTAFTIERVTGPEPFDLKLTLDESPRGPRVYYGRTAETANDNIESVFARERGSALELDPNDLDD